jgi:hypothetical protein
MIGRRIVAEHRDRIYQWQQTGPGGLGRVPPCRHDQQLKEHPTDRTIDGSVASLALLENRL